MEAEISSFKIKMAGPFLALPLNFIKDD